MPVSNNTAAYDTSAPGTGKMKALSSELEHTGVLAAESLMPHKTHCCLNRGEEFGKL
jgi:hypothetical protein